MRRAGYLGLILAPTLIAGLAAGSPGSPSTGAGEPAAIDCAGDPEALARAPATVQHEDAGELHQYWLLTDRPDLWATAAPPNPALAHYRRRVGELVPDTSALGLIRLNREQFPWLEHEHPAVRTINHLIESGTLGRHRPMSCLETQLLGFQASRFALFEHPTEIAALILKRADDSSARVKIYVLSDDDGPPPKPKYALEAMAADLDSGWRLWGTFHNHTFDLDSDRGHLAVAAPSADDLQVFTFLHESFGLEYALVGDGFSTLVLTADEFEAMAGAVAEAAPATDEPEVETTGASGYLR